MCSTFVSLLAILSIIVYYGVYALPADEAGLLSRNSDATLNATNTQSMLLNINDFPHRLFVGYHGTQSINAAIYEDKGVRRPRLTSGADAELGDGLYVTDDVDIARAFANNAKKAVIAKGTVKDDHGVPLSAKVCQIYAKDKTTWINSTPKVWMPIQERGVDYMKDSTNPTKKNEYEKNRIEWAKKHGVTGNFVRFGVFDQSKHDGNNQFAIPEPLQDRLVVKCFLVDPDKQMKGFTEDPALVALGTYHPKGDRFSYQDKIALWKIVGIKLKKD